ncbi:MAG: putative lipid II flippase FtsW [Clostridium sp.]|nr:putative lipid II flippase FtsW [Clostridium sp.]MCM1444586.1 putative lipid II flippase FtsW [Candidatus Amulumruptor caecigallinarius]
MKKKSVDILLVISVILISIFGIIMIYSASYIWAEYKYGDPLKYVKNQALFFIIGLILMFIVSKIDYKVYLKRANIILITCIILLILVLIPGIGIVRNGSQSWFGVGSFGIQPSEFTKLGLIIFTSKYLMNNEKKMKSIKSGVLPILGVLFFIFGLIMLQPDFGTGMIIVVSIIGLLFVGGVSIKFFAGLVGFGVAGITALILIAPYRLARILSFLNPWSDPLGSGFQIIQSLYAIGPGGLFGFGFLNSRQKHFYLPEPQTDFIFSIISEEFGFFGILLVTALFLTIIITGFKISKKCNDLFGKYLSFGIMFQLSFQALLNLMVVVGLIPVTGVTLPFLSYGGSSLMITLISIGIVLNISRNEK